MYVEQYNNIVHSVCIFRINYYGHMMHLYRLTLAPSFQLNSESLTFCTMLEGQILSIVSK